MIITEDTEANYLRLTVRKVSWVNFEIDSLKDLDPSGPIEFELSKNIK